MVPMEALVELAWNDPNFLRILAKNGPQNGTHESVSLSPRLILINTIQNIYVPIFMLLTKNERFFT